MVSSRLSTFIERFQSTSLQKYVNISYVVKIILCGKGMRDVYFFLPFRLGILLLFLLSISDCDCFLRLALVIISPSSSPLSSSSENQSQEVD